jgi:hypothetical protein
MAEEIVREKGSAEPVFAHCSICGSALSGSAQADGGVIADGPCSTCFPKTEKADLKMSRERGSNVEGSIDV